MALSSDLISQFVKVTKDEPQAKTESTVYGTIREYNGEKYVQLDGSELLTPISATAEANDGERVTVTIKNHTATVTGNFSSPAARNDSVKDLDKKISYFDTIIADKVSVEALEAEVAKINALTADNVTIKETLTANKASIDELEAGNVTINEKLTANEAAIKKLDSEKITTEVLEATYATIENLGATNATVNNLQAAYGEFRDLTTDHFEANDASIGDLEAKNVDIENRLTANEAVIETLDAKYATIEKLESDYATIEQLNTTNANVDTLDADVADINTLMFGSASGTVLQTEFANAVIAQLGNAQIKSAMIDSVSASQIKTGDILTNNVRVLSEDGKLLISDETIQISDDNRVRVQIGKDASNDYSINIWDAEGNLMFSQGGITDKAIKDAIIRNDMVSENANISASKLDINSLFEEINGSEKTIKSTKIYLDDKEQTLDVAFTEMNTQVTTVQNGLDNLEIGGRNYALNSNVETQITHFYVLYQLTDSKNALKDKPIVVSFDAMRPEDAKSVNMYVYFRGSATIRPTSNTIGDVTTEYKRYYATIAPGADIDNATHIAINTGMTGISVFIKNVKVEIGTLPTDWTPAPEDTQAEITALTETVTSRGTELSVVQGQINSKVWQQDITEATKDLVTDTEMSTKYSELEQTIDGFKMEVSETTTSIQNQIDGAIQTFTGSAVPTLSNYPANEWTDTATRNQHIGDLFYVETEGSAQGFCYRFQLNNGTYEWVLLKDSEITKAIKEAEEANAAAEAVANNLSTNYSTTTQMNSAIDQKANEITSTVASTYTTKAEFDALEIGGRNYALNSNVETQITHFYVLYQLTDSKNALKDKPIVVSFDAMRPEDAKSVNMYVYFRGSATIRPTSNTIGDVTTEYKRYYATIAPGADIDNATHIAINTGMTGISVFIKNVKVEIGTLPTDWTPAPEDIETRMDSAETKITQNSESITSVANRTTTVENKFANYSTTAEMNSAIEQKANAITSSVSSTYTTKANFNNLENRTTTVENDITDANSTANEALNDATDNSTRLEKVETNIVQLQTAITSIVEGYNSSSMLIQNEDGWTFSISDKCILEDTKKALDTLKNSDISQDDYMNILNNAVRAVQTKTDCISLTTINKKPAIILKEPTSLFKLCITNTGIDFLYGDSDKPAYITADANEDGTPDSKFHIEKAEIMQELQQGDFVWKIRENGNMTLQWKG